LLTFIKIIEVKAQLRSTNMPQGYSSAEGNALFRHFQVVPEGNFYSLEYNGNKFAVLNKKTCSDLQAVFNGRQVRLTAYVQSKEWSNALKSWSKNKNSTTLTVEINMYGMRDVADEVGKVLSAAGTFLQQPRYGLDGISYYNPHYFRVPGFSDADSLDTPILTIKDPGSAPVQNTRPDDRDDASVEVTSILDSLSHHNLLKERVADVRIRQPLLP
jgi:SWI/SNF-related matrix-associated actin-dependent regulator of chromatin subfamily A3